MRVNDLARWIGAAAIVLLSAGVGLRADGTGQTAATAPKLAGMWEGTVVVPTGPVDNRVLVDVPFPFEITNDGGKVKASFLNGSQRISSTSSAIDGDKVVFTFAQYNTTLNATFKDGALSGEYIRPKGRGAPLPFRAGRATVATSSAKAPSIDGVWITQARSNKGEQAWRFIVDQKGNQLTATILRVDGDTGTLYGSFKDGTFVLGHFSGARPLLVEVTPNADGTLNISQNKGAPLLAAREAEASAKSIGTPTDPTAHTTMKDPNEPFTFAFPDHITGQIVSNTDPRFRGKVVLVNISGSWCPNCHDETPFMVNLYKKYRSRGFEVVQLSFEEDDQQPGFVRLKGFNKNYGIEWTVLVPGNPDQLNEKVPQANNLNAFPTSFFVGRDGRVRAVHAGFPSPGSGEFYKEAEKEVTALVEKLLAEPVRTSSR